MTNPDVRHPMYLSFMLIVLALACISQHWLGVLVCIVSTLALYDDMCREESGNIEKFGDDYLRYMQRVPRVDFVAGVIWLLRSQTTQ